MDALLLQCEKDRYKIGYATLRWAKEIKQKENLPEPIPILIPRALREILTGKVTIEDVEKLPMAIKITPPPPPTITPASPALKMTPPAEEIKPVAPVAAAAPAGDDVSVEEAAEAEAEAEPDDEKPEE